MTSEQITRTCVLRRLVRVILAVTAVSITVLGHSRDEEAENRKLEDAKAAVAQVEEEWLIALNKADVNAIAGILAEDFLRPAPDSGQFVNKRDLLRFYRSHLSPQGSDRRRIEDMTVTVYGTTALARGILITTDSHGRVIRKLLFTDVFVRRAARWLAVSAQENLLGRSEVQPH
jgi:ketosteroid isomerase-like protein